jgi:hypothetical protein
MVLAGPQRTHPALGINTRGVVHAGQPPVTSIPRAGPDLLGQVLLRPVRFRCHSAPPNLVAPQKIQRFAPIRSQRALGHNSFARRSHLNRGISPPGPARDRVHPRSRYVRFAGSRTTVPRQSRVVAVRGPELISRTHCKLPLHSGFTGNRLRRTRQVADPSPSIRGLRWPGWADITGLACPRRRRAVDRRTLTETLACARERLRDGVPTLDSRGDRGRRHEPRQIPPRATTQPLKRGANTRSPTPSLRDGGTRPGCTRAAEASNFREDLQTPFPAQRENLVNGLTILGPEQALEAQSQVTHHVSIPTAWAWP